MRKITIRNDRFLTLLIITSVFEPPRRIAQRMVVIATIFLLFHFSSAFSKSMGTSFDFILVVNSKLHTAYNRDTYIIAVLYIRNIYSLLSQKTKRKKNIVFFRHERIQILLFSFGSENNSCVLKKAQTIFTKRSPMLFAAQKKSIQLREVHFVRGKKLVIKNCAINGKQSDDFQEISFFGQ